MVREENRALLYLSAWSGLGLFIIIESILYMVGIIIGPNLMERDTVTHKLLSPMAAICVFGLSYFAAVWMTARNFLFKSLFNPRSQKLTHVFIALLSKETFHSNRYIWKWIGTVIAIDIVFLMTVYLTPVHLDRKIIILFECIAANYFMLKSLISSGDAIFKLNSNQ